MHDDDPFRAVAELCRVPSPEEEHLRHCPFAFELDDEASLLAVDSSEIPVAPTGIMMLSAPDTFGERQNGDNIPRDTAAEDFHAPPEVSKQLLLQQEPVASVEGVGNGEGIEAVDGDLVDVDLARDTDLRFSLETESTERIEIGSGMISSPSVRGAHESEVICCESVDLRVSKRESTLNEGVCESTVKKAKISDKDLELGTPESGLVGTCGGKTLKTSLKTTVNSISPLNESNVLAKNLKSRAPRGSLAAESRKTLSMYAKMLSKLSSSARKSKDLDNNVAMETLRNDLDAETEKSGEILEESVDKSWVDVTDLCACGSKLPQDCQSKEKSIDDIDKFRNVGPSGAHIHKAEKDAKGKRALPASMLRKENAIREGDYKEITLLGILKRLAGNYHHDHDPSLENLSILEVAKRCGMTFP